MLHNWDELSRSEISLCGSYLHATSNMPLQELEWSWPKVCLHALWTAPQGFGKGFFSSASILNFMLAPRIAPWETGVHGTFAACLVALEQPPGSEVLLNRWSFVSNDQCWMLKPLCNVCITLTMLLCYCRCNRDKGNLLVFIAVGNFRCLSPVSNYSSFITSPCILSSFNSSIPPSLTKANGGAECPTLTETHPCSPGGNCLWAWTRRKKLELEDDMSGVTCKLKILHKKGWQKGFQPSRDLSFQVQSTAFGVIGLTGKVVVLAVAKRPRSEPATWLKSSCRAACRQPGQVPMACWFWCQFLSRLI